MTKKTFIKGVALFLSSFSNVKVKDATQEIWFELLEDLTDEQFIYSIKKIIAEVKEFYPTTNFIALVREQITVDIEAEALIAWEAVKKAMALQGAYRSVKFSDPVIHSVIMIMASGWPDFCHREQNHWVQKDFMRYYQQLSQRTDHPEYLKGIHDIENTGSGYLSHVKKPKYIEVATKSGLKALNSPITDNIEINKLLGSLSEKMK